MNKKTLLSKILQSEEMGEPIYCISDKLPCNKTIPKNISGAVVAVKDENGIIEYLSEETDFFLDVNTGEFKLSEECSDRNVGNVVYIFYSAEQNRDDFPYVEEASPRYRKAQYKYSPLEKLSFDHKLRNKKIRLEKSLKY